MARRPGSSGGIGQSSVGSSSGGSSRPRQINVTVWDKPGTQYDTSQRQVKEAISSGKIQVDDKGRKIGGETAYKSLEEKREGEARQRTLAAQFKAKQQASTSSGKLVDSTGKEVDPKKEMLVSTKAGVYRESELGSYVDPFATPLVSTAEGIYRERELVQAIQQERQRKKEEGLRQLTQGIVTQTQRQRFEEVNASKKQEPFQQTTSLPPPKTEAAPEKVIKSITSGEYESKEAGLVTESKPPTLKETFVSAYEKSLEGKSKKNILEQRKAVGSGITAGLSELQRKMRETSTKNIGRETNLSKEIKAGLAGAGSSGLGLVQFGVESSTRPIQTIKTGVKGIGEGAKQVFVERKPPFTEIGRLINQETSFAFGFIAAEVGQDFLFAKIPTISKRISPKYKGVKTTAFGEEVVKNIPLKPSVSTKLDEGRLIRSSLFDDSLDVKRLQKTVLSQSDDVIDLKLIPETGEIRKTKPLKAVSQTTIPLKETPSIPKISKTQEKILDVVKKRGDVVSGSLAQKTIVKGERKVKDIDILSYNPLETAQQIKSRLGKGARIEQGTRSTKVIYKGKEVADVVPIAIGEEGFINIFDKAVEVKGIQFLQPEARLASKVEQLGRLPTVRPSSPSFAQRQKVLEDIRLLTGGKVDTRLASFRGGFGFSQAEQASFVGQKVTLASSAEDFFRARPSQIFKGDDLTIGQRIKRTLGKEVDILPGKSKDVKGIFSTPTLAEEGAAQARKSFVSGSVEANIVDLVTEPIEDLTKSLFKRRKKAQIIIQPDVKVVPKGTGGTEAFGRLGSSELEVTQFIAPSGERGVLAKDKLLAKTIIQRPDIPGKQTAFKRKVPTDIIQAKFIDPAELGEDIAKALKKAKGPSDLTPQQILKIETKTKLPIASQFTTPEKITDVPGYSDKIARVVDEVSSEGRPLEIKVSAKRPLRVLARTKSSSPKSTSKSLGRSLSIASIPSTIKLSKVTSSIKRVSTPKISTPSISTPKPSRPRRGSSGKPSRPKSPPPSVPISPPSRPPKSPPKSPPTSPPISIPKVPIIKITTPPIPLPRPKRVRPIKRSKIIKSPKRSLYLPDFTARVFNLGFKAPKESKKRKKFLKKLLEEEFSGLEVRPGVILK